MLVRFRGRVCLLFRGDIHYVVKNRVTGMLDTKLNVCLLQLPRIVDGQIVFQCLFPNCPAVIEMGVNKRGGPKIFKATSVHTCAHENNGGQYLDQLCPVSLHYGSDKFWFTEKGSYTDERFVIKTQPGEVFCFSYDLTIRRRKTVDVEALKDHCLRIYSKLNKHWAEKLNDRREAIIKQLGRLGVTLTD